MIEFSCLSRLGLLFFFLMIRPHPRSTLFPYTTLFRSLDVLGRVEVRLASAEADDVAACRFQRACFIRDRDGRGRLHTVERSRQEGHHRLLWPSVMNGKAAHDSI